MVEKHQLKNDGDTKICVGHNLNQLCSLVHGTLRDLPLRIPQVNHHLLVNGAQFRVKIPRFTQSDRTLGPVDSIHTFNFFFRR